MKGRSKKFSYWLLFIITYLLLEMISLETRDPWSLSSTIAFPAGLVLGTLSVSSRTSWPLWGVSAAVMHVGISMLYGRTLDIALTFASLDLAVLFPLAILWQNTYRYLRNISYRSGILLLLTGIYFASILGGLLGQSMLMLLDYPVIFSHFFTWSLSNATGCLAGAPFFIVQRFVKEKRLSFSFFQVSVLLFLLVVFLLPPGELLDTPLLNQALRYLVLGVSLMLAMWWPLRALTLYFIFLALLVSLTTLNGYGPFAVDASGMQNSQLYLLALISLGLIVATHAKELSSLNDKRQQQLLLLSNLLQKQQPIFFQLSPDMSQLTWLQNESVFDIPTEKMPTLPLFEARIHPDDYDIFADCLSANKTKQQPFQQFTLRLLLADFRYHTVRCSLMSGYPQFSLFGVLLLSA